MIRGPHRLGHVLALAGALGVVAVGQAASAQPAEPAASTAGPGVPSARNVDHLGLSVPNLEQATRFFVDVLGAQVLMTGGPWSDPKGGSFARILGVDRNASIKVAMLRVGPVTSVELVEFTTPGQRQVMPKASDWGAAHLALFVDDIDGAAAALRRSGVKVLEGPVTNGPGPIEGSRYIYFMSPWGMPMELEQRSGPMAYEAPGRRPYGPAPSWRWRPPGEVDGEVVVLQVLDPGASGSVQVETALAHLERSVRTLPGTFDYQWRRTGGASGRMIAYGRFADAASADAAGSAARRALDGMGRLEIDRLDGLSGMAPEAAGR